MQTDLASTQIVELRAVAVAFQLFANNAFNLYTESHYTFTAIQVIETVAWIGIGSSQVKIPFQQIQDAIHLRKTTCFVGHTRAHSNLPGPLAEGNAFADKFTQLVILSQVELHQQSHTLHNQNSKNLKKQLGLTREIGHQIFKQCALCPQ